MSILIFLVSAYSTFIGYSWTSEDREELDRLGSPTHDYNWRVDKDYCENKLNEKKDKFGKLINEDKVFIWKGFGADDYYEINGIRFLGCDVACCQKKLR